MLFSLAIAGCAFGQPANSTILKELDEQIWRPFIKHYTALDAENFNNIHTKDVLRGGPWGIRIGEEYFKGNIEGNKRSREAGEKRQIAFRFEHRVTKDSVAYEVGYYRVKSIRNGKEQTFYGRFDVVSKKIDGRWKIAQDWDVDGINGKPFTEADFLGTAANPVIYE
jgi:ketosteroid isomerase-like protein